MKHSYYFHPRLVVRTPALPFDSAFDQTHIGRLVAEPAFAEALYLASPVLYQESRKWQADGPTAAPGDARKTARLGGSLARYYARMSSRSTPFGLFAGCGVLRWGAASQVRRSPANDRRHTRLDMHYLCALAQALSRQPVVRARLHYRPNSSLYRLHQELRYTEFRVAAGQPEHQLSAVAATPALQQVLAASRGGATRQQLAQTLVDAETSLEAALAFVDELIEAQLLVSELEPTVTGIEFMPHLVAVLGRLQAASPHPELARLLQVLAEVAAGLQALDQASQPNPPAAYERVVAALQALEVPVEAGKLFQTDLLHELPGATLDQQLQPRLLAALDALRYLAPPARTERLEQFKQRFQARYEDQEVPLLEALDSESGLSYATEAPGFSSLVHDLDCPPPAAAARTVSQTDAQLLLYRKLRAAERAGDYEVELRPEELAPFKPLAAELPPSVSVMFRVLDGQRLVLDSVGGSSGANLLGRFAHAEPRIAALVREVAALEQQHNPAVRFAEICHLPASRIGNILLRPCFRELEIPYLAQSGLPAGQQLPLQDLRLSLRRGQLLLRSASRNQYIVPRLSSAHNYSTQALPVYQFLCDLQTQGLQASLNFSWAAISPCTQFLPRLSYQQVILQPAAWQLDAAELQPLLAAAEPERELPAFRARWRLPQLFTLADGDNELLVDAHNPVTVRAWLEAIRGRPSIRLREFLFDPAASPVSDAAGRGYVHQFVATLLRHTPSYAPPAPRPAPDQVAQREFALGSEWLYVKLYCGPKVANRLLTEVVAPLTAELQARELVDKWFFIRYADPDHHLRVRLHLPTPARIGEVVRLLDAYAAPARQAGSIWKLQTDTYRRELERYGAPTIALAEDLFCADSAAAVQLLARTAEAPDADRLHWLGGLYLIEALLTACDYSPEQKLTLLTPIKESFAREFHAGKDLKLQLDAKYRAHRPAIQRVLAGLPPDDETEFPFDVLGYHAAAPVAALTGRLRELAAADALAVPLDQLLGSYVHMLLNRLVAVQPRLHELVVYDFLHRHYVSEQARSRAAISCLRP
ncbi:lantibiotic dehydratase [Hymenobacter sp. B81]|uniref:lantibiotic dehydratase n=1 Tax=Hymenobacter sp. B81 TaxID=3344878 RepID=UPI0037DD5D05